MREEEGRSIFSKSDIGDEEQLYFGMIDRAIKEGKNEIISNGRPAHAIYLIYKFLKTAKTSVKICTGSLARKVENWLAYEEPKLAKAAIEFLKKDDSSLSIVVLDELNVDSGQAMDHPFIAKIQNAADVRGKLTVSTIDSDDSEGFPKYHFLVMDGKAIRIETEPGSTKAYVNFGDAKFGELLDDIFDLIEQRGTQLIPAQSA